MTGNLTIINQSGAALDLINLEGITGYIVAEERPLVSYEIALTLVNSAEMRSLNRRFRGQDATTDVLSFTVEGDDLPIQIRDEVLIGDIVIDINQIEKQRGHINVKDELIRVYIHGLLHLLGYDHIRSQDKEVMEQTEQKYLTRMKGTNVGQQ
ncbi:MAG: rRNA maturation RNase YbeY [Candidatus Cloacimonetes bacterium]|nr:rRNA maturation RNase YbeY [Candidatus Cloacimonadota bacterium]